MRLEEFAWKISRVFTHGVAEAEEDASALLGEPAWRLPPDFNRPPPHIHHREDETFYILEGEFSLLRGDQTFAATAGSLVYIPKGTLHTFKNVGISPGRFLVVITPAGFEKFFEEIGELATDKSSPPPFSPATVEKLMALAPRYNLEVRMS